MATYDACVRQALKPEQQDLIDHQEHCSADPARLDAVGAALRDQVRIRRGDHQYALYTVSELRPETPDTVVRMGRTGRERLGTSDEFAGAVDTQVTRSDLSDDRAQATGEFVERLCDDGAHTGLVVLAPHGGEIEPHTDDQAERVASQLASRRVSCWLCKGYKRDEADDASRTWHITSEDISPRSFPLLGTVIGRGFQYAVSFHGFRRDEILVGGAAPDCLKEEVADAIGRALAGSTIQVRVAQPGDAFGGDSPDNIVNRITANRRNGIQIEQSLAARKQHAQLIADAVAGVYRTRLTTRRRAGAVWARLLGLWRAALRFIHTRVTGARTPDRRDSD
jgi:phage replication-related protein YjqB (UPF0714/DUF867 family)